jgi:hypothetical protein
MVAHGLLCCGRVPPAQRIHDLAMLSDRLVESSTDLVGDGSEALNMIIQVTRNQHQALRVGLVDDSIVEAFAQFGTEGQVSFG